MGLVTRVMHAVSRSTHRVGGIALAPFAFAGDLNEQFFGGVGANDVIGVGGLGEQANPAGIIVDHAMSAYELDGLHPQGHILGDASIIITGIVPGQIVQHLGDLRCAGQSIWRLQNGCNFGVCGQRNAFRRYQGVGV